MNTSKNQMKIDYTNNITKQTNCYLVSEEGLTELKLTDIEIEDFKNAKNGQILVTYKEEKRIILIGFGQSQNMNHVKVIENTRKLINTIKKLEIQEIDVINLTKTKKFPINHFIKTIITQNYSFDKYLEKKKIKIKEINLIGFQRTHNPHVNVFSENTNYVKDLVNDNADVITPEFFETESKRIAQLTGLTIKILDNQKMKELKMGLITASGAASKYPPRIIILEHLPQKDEPITLLVGKGITFDTGGINLKPTGYIETMRTDMAGAATVLGIMKTISEIKLQKNVIGILAVSENMIGPDAVKPGDILIAHNGISVEVTNTDAEGRLVLGDAISYAVDEYKPSEIIDLATLTGSVVASLGSHATGIISNNTELVEKIKTAAKHTHQRVWRLPLWKEYREMIKSKTADIRNTGNEKNSGAITGAAFIEKFVNKTPWAHLDIAGSAFIEKATQNRNLGATGWGVELLTHYLLEKN